MVQNYLVGAKISGWNNLQHLIKNNLMYNMVFFVYFYFVGKMGNFHSDPVRDVDSYGNLLNLLM